MHASQVKCSTSARSCAERHGRSGQSSKKHLLVSPTRVMNVIDEIQRGLSMTTFRIDADNNITALGASQQIEESGGETFGNLQELTALAEKWSAARLVEIWNSLPGV